MSPAYATASQADLTDYTERGGKQWTMPFGQAISGIITYNEEIVKAEGLTPPADLWANNKWTWATLQEYAVQQMHDQLTVGIDRGFK